MPMYTYKCEKCEHQFDALKKVEQMDEQVDCTECGNPSNRVPFVSGSSGNVLKFKGAGWYCTNPDNYR